LPAAADIVVKQDRTGLPSKCTVHAPHNPIPQPNLVPVKSNCSRNAHNRGMSASALIETALPLTDILIMGYFLCSFLRKVGIASRGRQKG
jgi:hypothetical protein